ncbi:MAG TPA: hypothetical protein VGE06_04150, partial [Flavisolibacter sp.]
RNVHYLSESFRAGTGRHNDPQSLRSVAHYCALPENESFEDLPPGKPVRMYSRDEMAAEIAVNTLNTFGLPVWPKAVQRLYNAADGDDILAKPQKADLIFFHRPFVGGRLSNLFSRIPGPVRKDAALFWQSPLSFTPKNWHNCAVASEAKVIINVTDKPFRHELPTAYLDKPPYWHGLSTDFPMEGLNGGVLGYQLDLLFHEDWPPAQALRKTCPQIGKKTLPFGLSWLRNALQN